MVRIHRITTNMGKSVKKLPFLTELEQSTFDNIGYTGKDLNGNKSTFESYLNSLDKGEFSITQTKFDDGSFSEEYTIAHVPLIGSLFENIGKQCSKKSPKPFKSGEKVNTIKGIIKHPQLGIPAYIFEEDESYVECRRCVILNEKV